MRLPRRTPWAHISELDEVCRMIYSESSTLETKRKALNRVSHASPRSPYILTFVPKAVCMEMQYRSAACVRCYYQLTGCDFGGRHPLNIPINFCVGVGPSSSLRPGHCPTRQLSRRPAPARRLCETSGRYCCPNWPASLVRGTATPGHPR